MGAQQIRNFGARQQHGACESIAQTIRFLLRLGLDIKQQASEFAERYKPFLLRFDLLAPVERDHRIVFSCETGHCAETFREFYFHDFYPTLFQYFQHVEQGASSELIMGADGPGCVFCLLVRAHRSWQAGDTPVKNGFR